MATNASQDTALHQLQSEQSKLLDGIDELRAIGIGGLVELPQLIVCGNQSSGKSSVLEAISRVRFPAKSNVCTRFATEVILRRRQTEHIKISIEPGLSRTDDKEKQRLRSFAPDTLANADDLKNLIEKANQHMGISDSVDVGFSDDVLKVEISGPDKPELTLVDLPGLYYSTSKDQGAHGRSIVRALTERYMKNTRSIILAVISAKTDYHLQEVLDIAKQFDPPRERTLGIITQPDILEAGSEEQETWLQFLKNEKIRLQLGWHALKNRNFEARNISHEERDEHEKDFFKEGRWASVPRNCVGIDSLRSRLSNVLFKHVRRNLPGLISDINEKILDRQQQLNKMGTARSTLQQQKGFLLNISSNFERIASQALNGMYADDFFGGLDQDPKTQDFRRLRAVVRELNECFAEAMEFRGCRRWIWGSLFSALPPIPENIYLENWKPNTISRKILEIEVSEQARKNRGVELPGSANQLLVGELFRDQSKPWEEISERHLITVWESVRYFVSLVLQHLTDEHTYSLLAGAFVEPELNKMKDRLLEKLAELTSYLKRGHPLPVGKKFINRIQKSRSERQFKKLKAAINPSLSVSSQDFKMSDLETAVSKLEVSSDEFAAAEIIEEMQAYYDIAIVTFVDNVATLGIENCLLGPLDSMLTSQTINNMDEKQIQVLAAEPPFVQEERDRLNGELEKLQAGLRTFASLNVYKPSVPLFAAQPTFTAKPATSFNPSPPLAGGYQSGELPRKSEDVSQLSGQKPGTSAPPEEEKLNLQGLGTGGGFGGFGAAAAFPPPTIGPFGNSFLPDSSFRKETPSQPSKNGTSDSYGRSSNNSESPRPLFKGLRSFYDATNIPSTRNDKDKLTFHSIPNERETEIYQHICSCEGQFRDYSPEELRLGDYQRSARKIAKPKRR